jgi:hypothetical protein
MHRRNRSKADRRRRNTRAPARLDPDRDREVTRNRWVDLERECCRPRRLEGEEPMAMEALVRQVRLGRRR